MKLSYYLLANLYLILFLAGCQTNLSNDEVTHADEPKTVVVNETKGMREYDMRNHELDIHVWIPEKFYNDEDDLPRFVNPIISHNEGEARWEITVPGDRHWNMVIEELGEDSTSISDEIERHSTIPFFSFNYEDVGDEQMIYSRLLKSENTTLDSSEIELLPNYHFYCSRNINGYHLVFRNHEMKDFRKITIKKMLASARNAY
jgi:hypothetical protein